MRNLQKKREADRRYREKHRGERRLRTGRLPRVATVASTRTTAGPTVADSTGTLARPSRLRRL